jgi:hypothetical protein
LLLAQIIEDLGDLRIDGAMLGARGFGEALEQIVGQRHVHPLLSPDMLWLDPDEVEHVDDCPQTGSEVLAAGRAKRRFSRPGAARPGGQYLRFSASFR